MPQARKSSLLDISKALHAQYDAKMREPLPERWVDLIRRLNELDRIRSEATQRQTEAPAEHKTRKN